MQTDQSLASNTVTYRMSPFGVNEVFPICNTLIDGHGCCQTSLEKHTEIMKEVFDPAIPTSGAFSTVQRYYIPGQSCTKTAVRTHTQCTWHTECWLNRDVSGRCNWPSYSAASWWLVFQEVWWRDRLSSCVIQSVHTVCLKNLRLTKAAETA